MKALYTEKYKTDERHKQMEIYPVFMDQKN